MGNSSSCSEIEDAEGVPLRTNRVLVFLRTWTVIVRENWTKRRRMQCRPASVFTTSQEDTLSHSSFFDSQYSTFSYCSCSQCQGDDGFSSGCYSDLFDRSGSFIKTGAKMAPNSDDATRFIPTFPYIEDVNREKQRPPIYNPEDYALSLKKWGRKSPNGGPQNGVSLYSSASTGDLLEGGSRSQNNSFRDYRNPMLTSSGSEMTLRQFGTVSELLAKLKSDLRLAYPSFVQEFVADPLDGVTLLLDLLRAIQLSQSNNHPGASSTTGKVPPSVQRRALLDELSCLQCLLNCCQRYSEAIRKLTANSASLFTLSICIMSNVNKSRIIALQLLTKACEIQTNGHSAVSEALSTLRLRFGEPVRFRFLVGMLTSTGGQKELLAAGMKFLNRFLDTAGTPQKRLYVQAELEQAGFDVAVIKKNIGTCHTTAEQIFKELDHWEKNHIDVETLMIRIEDAERDNDSLRDKIILLERKVQILQEEKGVLISLEQCLKERCSELQGEVLSLKSDEKTKKDGSTPEDEGISSSERSITPEEGIQRESSVYEVYSIQSETIPLATESPQEDDDDDETTIEEVIEELRNIINDAESEQTSTKVKIKILPFEDEPSRESEIIPSNLHPQPPRKARSLVHLFIPSEDYEYIDKTVTTGLFFENETPYTSDSGSDSLLSASKCHETNPPKPAQTPPKPMTRRIDQQTTKSKSLDRIDSGGLDSLVDIVVTDSTKSGIRPFDDKQRMFLPAATPNNEVPYYFPRIPHDRHSSSFLVRRGHTNAGLYSGLVRNSDGGGSCEFRSIGSGSLGLKVTDLPSGLY